MKVACQLMKITTNVCVIKRGRDRKMFWVMQRSMPNGLVYSTQLTKSFISAGAPLWRHSLWLCVCTCISVWFLLCVTLCCNNKCLLDMEEVSHPWSTWVSTYTTHYSMSVTWTEVHTHTFLSLLLSEVPGWTVRQEARGKYLLTSYASRLVWELQCWRVWWIDVKWLMSHFSGFAWHGF